MMFFDLGISSVVCMWLLTSSKKRCFIEVLFTLKYLKRCMFGMVFIKFAVNVFEVGMNVVSFVSAKLTNYCIWSIDVYF